MILDFVGGEIELFSVLDGYREPGRLQRRLYSMAIKRATILTVNFDDLLERALAASGATPVTVHLHDGASEPGPKETAVIKLHGSRRDWVRGVARRAPSDHQPFATDEQIARFSPRLELSLIARTRLRELVNDRILVVVGYSGSDDLDIVPALAHCCPRCCIWLDHNSKVSYLALGGRTEARTATARLK